jgi:hypothetical protein
MDRRTTFAMPCRTRSTSSPALTFTGGRCHRAAAVAAACSCGHSAGDRRGPSRVAPRVRKGPWMLVPPLATVAGDPPRRRPTGVLPPLLSADGMMNKKGSYVI